MHYPPNMYPYQHPYYGHVPMYYSTGNSNQWNSYGQVFSDQLSPYHAMNSNQGMTIRDYGRTPFVININEATKQNNTYRTALWTGNHLQTTLMSINPGEDIGLEIHPDVDQFLRIEQGQGVVQMGKNKDQLDFIRNVQDDFAIFIPAGTWHNVTNTGNIPLKLYSIYAPPNHPFGTIHRTKAEAMHAEKGNSHLNYHQMNGYGTLNY
jgi:mannose-6-phosphate isomerase-like protein (cupin superfamily)